MIIMIAMTLIQFIRLLMFIWRLIANQWSSEGWVWYRISTDFTNYLLGVIALVLIIQWHQTYRVLNNPIDALQTFEKNWARVAQLALIATYTIFIVFDVIVVIIDASTQAEDQKFIDSIYEMLECIQAILNAGDPKRDLPAELRGALCLVLNADLEEQGAAGLAYVPGDYFLLGDAADADA
eukprot:CAMPEP_0185599726 /NCGR_PEP_ID=MMETSP0434-20130131/82897_1 /TAXON_ID=626734 ORGANISM="Favella taraikaensis, Strain Fe Narragansett Bay" /NCGR_SAMPLE_ID=MMETSP0434 /ASSEMBLY_ACC=CAM_ASM_000379 /LENGTH=180 /DNA_ID=CAMNT_0028229227 /DNA_START=84 /DNA_END=626 /DNA_ORIENTATION=-